MTCRAVDGGGRWGRGRLRQDSQVGTQRGKLGWGRGGVSLQPSSFHIPGCSRSRPQVTKHLGLGVVWMLSVCWPVGPSHSSFKQEKLLTLNGFREGHNGISFAFLSPYFHSSKGPLSQKAKLGKTPLCQAESCAKGIRAEMIWEPRCLAEEGSQSAATKESGKRGNKQPSASCPPLSLPPHVTLPTNLLQPVPISQAGERRKGVQRPILDTSNPSRSAAVTAGDQGLFSEHPLHLLLSDHLTSASL